MRRTEVQAKIGGVDLLQVLAEPTRREIVRLVWDDELAASDIAAHFDATFGAVSQHLRVLREAGVVNVRSAGTRRFYQADREALGPLAQYLRSMWSTNLDALAELAEQVQREEHSTSRSLLPAINEENDDEHH